jgi:hypothetical protein
MLTVKTAQTNEGRTLTNMLQLIGHQEMADRGHVRTAQLKSLDNTVFQLRAAGERYARAVWRPDGQLPDRRDHTDQIGAAPLEKWHALSG